MANVKMKPNLLFKYGRSGWCRHGLVLTHDDGRGLYAADTYWGGSYSDNKVEIAALEASGEFIADLDEFRRSDYNEYGRYADADRVWIPLGGSIERHLVRKNAKPDPTAALEQIASEIEMWESKKRSAEWNIERLKKELETFLAQPAPVGKP